MFAVIGIIALTLLFAFVSMYPFAFGMMMLGGFDEYRPILGLFCMAVFILIWVAWWFLVGTHIHLHVSGGVV